MGATLTRAFAEYGWCTAIRGAEGGGKVEGLPSHVFVSDDGAVDQKSVPPKLVSPNAAKRNSPNSAFAPVPLQKIPITRYFSARKPRKTRAVPIAGCHC